MIQIICDKCGVNCGRVALEIRVSVIENPTPTHALDTGDLKITSDHSKDMDGDRRADHSPNARLFPLQNRVRHCRAFV